MIFFGSGGLVAIAAAALIAAALAAGGQAAERNSYIVHNLVSDQPGVADHLDTNLVNAWGFDARPTSPWWVADNGSDVSTLYNAAGVAFPPPPASPLVVQVPHAPTGLVANPGSSFAVQLGSASGPALFLFSTEEGTILGWKPLCLAGCGRGRRSAFGCHLQGAGRLSGW
jgi:hypothetical protein